MTTLQQQIEHFKEYWNIPEEELAKLRQLIIKDYLETKSKQLEKQLVNYCSQITFDNYYGEVLW